MPLKPLKIAVSGSRAIPISMTSSVIKHLKPHLKPGDRLLVGDCPTGADLIVREHATAVNTHCTVFVAEWDKLGRSAGPARNRKMVSHADVLVAFKMEGQGNRGTCNAIKEAGSKGIPVFEYLIKLPRH